MFVGYWATYCQLFSNNINTIIFIKFSKIAASQIDAMVELD